MQEQPSEFQSTIISVIRGAAGSKGVSRAEYMDRFFRDYAPPLRNYLVRSLRVSPEAADDLLQQFILEKLLCEDDESNLANRYLQKQTQWPNLRFRGYLVRALKNFVLDEQRRGQNRTTVSLDQFADPTLAPVSPVEEDQFTHEWGRHLLTQAIKLVREDCYAHSGQEVIWKVFESRVVAPLRSGAKPEPYDRLASRLQIATPKMASNRFQTAIRKLHAVLRELVSGYLPAESHAAGAAIDDEIAELVKTAAMGKLHVLEKVADWQDESWLPAKRYDLTCHPDELWQHDDYLGIWDQMMQMPLDDWMRDFDPALARRFADVTIWDGSPMANLADVWRHAAPPIELLQAIKANAKAPRDSQAMRDGNGLPTMINAVLYHAAIAAADLRRQTRISRDSNHSFLDRLSSLLRVKWLDPVTRELLTDWRESLRSG